MSANFDQAYYERFYVNPETRAASPAEQQRQARFIAAYLKYLELRVERIADIGCGLGHLLKALGKAFPHAQCDGVEISAYLCREYGWEEASVAEYEADPYDLVICTDVLGYLDNETCDAALSNLARLADGALYLSVLTEDDMVICDREHTDLNQTLRSRAWYLKRLEPHFVNVGGGLFLKRPLQVAVWHLERCL